MEIKTIHRPWQKSYGTRTDHDKRYNGQQWKKTREIHKLGFTEWNGQKVSNTLCIECFKKGRIVPMHTVDHIIRVKDGADFYDLDNFQSLCLTCHNRKSAIEGNQLKK